MQYFLKNYARFIVLFIILLLNIIIPDHILGIERKVVIDYPKEGDTCKDIITLKWHYVNIPTTSVTQLRIFISSDVKPKESALDM